MSYFRDSTRSRPVEIERMMEAKMAKGSSLNCVGIVLQRILLGVFVVRPEHPDFTPAAQRHQDEREIVSPVCPQKTAKNRQN